MKTKILIFVAFCMLFFSVVENKKACALSKVNPEDSLNILSTPDLLNLTSIWVKEYQNLNPKVKIKVVGLSEYQTLNSQYAKGKLCFISNEGFSEIKDESVWKMVVGMDAIVPIISSKNPFIDEIKLKGISPEMLTQIFNNPEKQNWGTILLNNQKNPFKIYILNNESVKLGLANFLNLEQTKITGTNVVSEEELISVLQKDQNAIGFCQVADILDSKNQNIDQNIKLLPIDKNGNGKVDYNENIYDDFNGFLRGVWIGKYPKELCQNIYSISSAKPTNENEVAFLVWVLTSGQQYLNTKGYSDLTYTQKQANIDSLFSKAEITQTTNYRSALITALLILAGITVLFLTTDYVIKRIKTTRKIEIKTASISTPFINENSFIVLDGLYFDKSHTWAFMEKDGVISIGIDDFLQHITGPITRVKMKNPGEIINKGEPFLTIIQDGKQLNIKAPISGTIKANNTNLFLDTSLLNKSPYSEGWIYMIEPKNWLRDTQFLIMAQGYKEWLKMEFLHLRDFLAVTLRSNYAEHSQIVLQDGGEIRNGILKDLKPEVWEDFQTHFLDNSK